MGRKTETVEVGGHSYEITQLGATLGMEIYHDLIRAVGPSIRSKLGSLSSLVDDDNEESTKASIAGLIIEVIEVLPKELMRTLVSEFTKTTKVRIEAKGGQAFVDLSPLYDQHFAGKPGPWTQWMIQCLRHNYLDFLSSTPSDE